MDPAFDVTSAFRKRREWGVFLRGAANLQLGSRELVIEVSAVGHVQYAAMQHHLVYRAGTVAPPVRSPARYSFAK